MSLNKIKLSKALSTLKRFQLETRTFYAFSLFVDTNTIKNGGVYHQKTKGFENGCLTSLIVWTVKREVFGNAFVIITQSMPGKAKIINPVWRTTLYLRCSVDFNFDCLLGAKYCLLDLHSVDKKRSSKAW